MAKGMFTAAACLLTDGRTRIADIRDALESAGFEIVRESFDHESWAHSGPSLVVPFRPDVNGYAAVDAVSEPWPDAMGDPKSEVTTFGAWSMGFFGPLTYPGGLERAGQHAWAWSEGRAVASRHRGFVRFRISYVFGADDEVKIMPPDYAAIAELDFLNRMVLATIDAPGVLCYFNPNGEVLCDAKYFREVREMARRNEVLPLPLWGNVRFYNLSDEYGFMDTVGNGQFDVRDVEAIFPSARYEPGTVGNYLRNVTQYLIDLDREMKPGDTIDGPGETGLSWTLELLDDGVVAPPRRVLRLYPQADARAVRTLLANVDGATA
jgi:hypothetical protein